MSICYSLEIQSMVSRGTIVSLLQEKLEATPLGKSLVTDDLEIEVIELSASPLRAPLELHGIRPNLMILFTVEKFGDRENARDILTQGMVAVFGLGLEGAMLLYNGDEPLLLRDGEGRIWLKKSDFWQENRLALLPWSYQWRDLPIL